MVPSQTHCRCAMMGTPIIFLTGNYTVYGPGHTHLPSLPSPASSIQNCKCLHTLGRDTPNFQCLLLGSRKARGEGRGQDPEDGCTLVREASDESVAMAERFVDFLGGAKVIVR